MFNTSKIIRITLGVILYCIFGNIAQSATVEVQPLSLTVNQSQTFSLDIKISDVTDLYAYQFEIGYDPLILQATSITEGSFLSGGGTTNFTAGDIDNTAGTISLTANTLQGLISGVSGPGILATIGFGPSGIGSSTVSLSNVLLLDSGLNEISASTGNGNVTVSSVPIPATVWLFGSALAGLGLFGKRRKD
jgi:hypothetical protein